MKKFSRFSLLIYCSATVLVPMFITEPIISLLSLFCSSVCLICLCGSRARAFLPTATVIIVLSSLINPIFSSRGATELFFVNAHAITAEAILCGAFTGAMISSVLIWFAVFPVFSVGGELMYLLGGVLPKTCVTLSAAVRFVPLLISRMKRIREAQIVCGRAAGGKAGGMRVFSACVSWALEDSVCAGDSMTARGYPGVGVARQGFRLRCRDIVLILISAAAIICILLCSVFGKFNYSFYPSFYLEPFGYLRFACYLSYAALALFPVFYIIKEKLKWSLYK